MKNKPIFLKGKLSSKNVMYGIYLLTKQSIHYTLNTLCKQNPLLGNTLFYNISIYFLREYFSSLFLESNLYHFTLSYDYGPLLKSKVRSVHKKRYYVYSSLDNSPLDISPNFSAQFALEVTLVRSTLVRWDRSPLTYNERQ